LLQRIPSQGLGFGRAGPGYGGGGGGGGNPVCQRCLKPGRWTFECCPPGSTVYVSRPSRTQQLVNPKLRQRFADAADQPPDPQREWQEVRFGPRAAA